LLLNYIAQAHDLLLGLSGRLIIETLCPRPGIANGFTHRLLGPSGRITRGSAKLTHFESSSELVESVRPFQLSGSPALRRSVSSSEPLQPRLLTSAAAAPQQCGGDRNDGGQGE